MHLCIWICVFGCQTRGNIVFEVLVRFPFQKYITSWVFSGFLDVLDVLDVLDDLDVLDVLDLLDLAKVCSEKISLIELHCRKVKLIFHLSFIWADMLRSFMVLITPGFIQR